MRFRLHWKDGKTEVVEGNTIADACNKAGIGAGALAALDYYSECAEDTLHTGPLAVVLDAVQTAEIAAKEAPSSVFTPDNNPHGLPTWTVTAIELVKDMAEAWWFAMDTLEGVTILVGEVNGAPQVTVFGEGYSSRSYGGTQAAERVEVVQRFWREVCEQACWNPNEERKFLLGRDPAAEEVN